MHLFRVLVASLVMASSATAQETILQPEPEPISNVSRAIDAELSVSQSRLANGEVTQKLLSLQASGLVAGPDRPILGPAASAMWDRYLKSFDHSIPLWFEKKVGKDER